MYKISVPVMNAGLKGRDRERTLQELKRFDAERVFLALDTYEVDAEERRHALDELSDNCRFFQSHGLEVGAWIWAFRMDAHTHFRHMRSIKGTEIREYVCPTDERFVAFVTDYIRDIAKCGVQIIQFDDDLRYGFLSDAPGCLCDGHIAAINAITGESSTREALAHHILCGAKNPYRDAFLQANGDALLRFAKAVRHAVNEVDPRIRIGQCACLTSWDIDGTHARELASALAGDTRPLVRLIGAPYWAAKQAWGNTLQDVIELERMESAWTRKGTIEIMAEGDAYPRPRSRCPASYLEGFDTAIRASGCTDGILKYGIDYCSRADYETGYARFHERNRDIYAGIERLFSQKTACGVRVYESMHKVSDMVMPTRVNREVDIEQLFFQRRHARWPIIPSQRPGRGKGSVALCLMKMQGTSLWRRAKKG